MFFLLLFEPFLYLWASAILKNYIASWYINQSRRRLCEYLMIQLSVITIIPRSATKHYMVKMSQNESKWFQILSPSCQTCQNDIVQNSLSCSQVSSWFSQSSARFGLATGLLGSDSVVVFEHHAGLVSRQNNGWSCWCQNKWLFLYVMIIDHIWSSKIINYSHVFGPLDSAVLDVGPFVNIEMNVVQQFGPFVNSRCEKRVFAHHSNMKSSVPFFLVFWTVIITSCRSG